MVGKMNMPEVSEILTADWHATTLKFKGGFLLKSCFNRRVASELKIGLKWLFDELYKM